MAAVLYGLVLASGLVFVAFPLGLLWGALPCLAAGLLLAAVDFRRAGPALAERQRAGVVPVTVRRRKREGRRHLRTAVFGTEEFTLVRYAEDRVLRAVLTDGDGTELLVFPDFRADGTWRSVRRRPVVGEHRLPPAGDSWLQIVGREGAIQIEKGPSGRIYTVRPDRISTDGRTLARRDVVGWRTEGHLTLDEQAVCALVVLTTMDRAAKRGRG
jgi:hypothetical protein